MSYITTQNADDLLRGEGDWLVIPLEERKLLLEKASTRIQMVPFKDDLIPVSEGGYEGLRVRYVDNFKPDPNNLDIEIEVALSATVAHLALWYHRNPKAQNYNPVNNILDSSPVTLVADLPPQIQSGLWNYMASPFRSGEAKARATPPTGENERPSAATIVYNEAGEVDEIRDIHLDQETQDYLTDAVNDAVERANRGQ